MSKVGQKSLEEVCMDCLYRPSSEKKEVWKMESKELIEKVEHSNPHEHFVKLGKINFEDVLERMLKTYNDKNNDYGNSFEKLFEEFGMTSSLIRLSDKLERLKTLQNRVQKVGDESELDTLLDMANYAIMTYVILTNK